MLAFGTQASLSTTQLNDAFIKAGRASSDDVRQLSTVARNLGLHLALVVSEFEHGEAIERIVDEGGVLDQQQQQQQQRSRSAK